MHSNEKCAEVLSLGKVGIEPFIQRHEHTLTNLLICREREENEGKGAERKGSKLKKRQQKKRKENRPRCVVRKKSDKKDSNREGPGLSCQCSSSFFLPWSVIPTVSSLPTTSPTNCADAALNWAKGVVKMVEGRRLGTRRDAHVRTASIRIDLCSDVR